MSEPVVDPRGLLRGLHANQIEYVVSGAVAMTLYGYVRLTEDLDLIIDPDEVNLDRVADWLISMNAVPKLSPSRPFGARERWGPKKGSNATVLTPLGQVDVIQRLLGLPDWHQVREEAEVYEIEEMRVPVINPHADRAHAPAWLTPGSGRHRSDREPRSALSASPVCRLAGR